MWRSSGDIDFLFSEDNYNNAVNLFEGLYPNNKNGGYYSKETAFYTEQWMIEVHGSLRTGLSSRIDKEIDKVQRGLFYGGNVRSWQNGKTLTFLPAPTNDVFLVFTHFIKHFYKEGMSIRQVCDWIRLLWTCQKDIDITMIEKRIKKAGLMDEWKTFATVAVDWLGMPIDAMPLYDADRKWGKKAEKMVNFIVGGHSGNKLIDTVEIANVFPWKALMYLPSIFLNINGLKIKERLFGND